MTRESSGRPYHCSLMPSDPSLCADVLVHFEKEAILAIHSLEEEYQKTLRGPDSQLRKPRRSTESCMTVESGTDSEAAPATLFAGPAFNLKHFRPPPQHPHIVIP
jgi:hypothetical protein